MKLNQLDKIEYSTERNYLILNGMFSYLIGFILIITGYSLLINAKLFYNIMNYNFYRHLITDSIIGTTAGTIILIFISIWFYVKIKKLNKKFKERGE